MSRYLMLVLAALSLTLTACGKDSDSNKNQPPQGRPLNKGAYPNVAQTVFGQWQGQDELENGVFFSSRVYVNQTSFGVEVTCRRGRDIVTVSFAVTADISENSIAIRESARKSEKVGELTCTAEISPSQFNYFVNGNVLTLETANKARLQLNRIL